MSDRPKTKFPEPEAASFADPELVAKLTRHHGEPWDLSDRNEIVALNPDWWASLFIAENSVIHDQDEGFFLFDDISGIYAPESPWKVATDFRARLFRAARESGLGEIRRRRKRAFVTETVDLMRGQSDQREPFHSKAAIVALQNGVVEMARGRFNFQEFDPRFLIRSKATVPFDAKGRCPRFEADFLAPMLEDEEDRDLLIRQLGLMLLGQNPCHRMAILEGDSAAGKTSLANLIVALIGEDRCVQLRTEHLEKQFELDALRGRTLLLGNDVGANFLTTQGAQTMKGLVSTDLYHPEAKNRRDRRPLRGPFNVLIGTNCKLSYRAQGDAAAWRRRLVLYPCRKPEGRKRITNFEYVLLREEGPGIVNLLLDGCRRALAEIEAGGDLVLGEAQQERIEKLILRSEPVETFIERCLVRDPEGDVTAQELLEGFTSFCHARGWPVGSEDDFFKRLGPVISDRFGVGRSHSLSRMEGGKAKTQRGWRNLRLLDEGWRSTE